MTGRSATCVTVSDPPPWYLRSPAEWRVSEFMRKLRKHGSQGEIMGGPHALTGGDGRFIGPVKAR
jgi:hypothetical protein